MKKLLATTALAGVVLSGSAFAQTTITGELRLGYKAMSHGTALDSSRGFGTEQQINVQNKGKTNNAKRALKYKKEKGSSCGTSVGWTRASQLANREPLSRDTIARMASFKRHQQHKDVPYSEGCGGLMWDCWGGSAGVNWAISKLKEIDG